MKGERMVIPPAMQEEILERVHAGHFGIVKCWNRAKTSVWWIGINKQIQEMVTNCATCIKERSNQVEPMIGHTLPERPWQEVATDLFEWNGASYLLLVDYFSRYPEMARLNSTSSGAVILHMKSIFGRHGIPETVMSDNGPQFSSEEFAKFAKDYGFQHKTSSPKYPQGNGEAERCVKTVKMLPTKSEDPYLGLMEYRATPLYHEYCPSELLMGRKIRTTLPIPNSSLEPRWPDWSQLRKKEMDNKQKQKSHFDRHHDVKELTNLREGTQVWVTSSRQRGTVIEKGRSPRSYLVKTETGTLRRNRRQLVAMQDDCQIGTSATKTTPSAAQDQGREKDRLQQAAANDRTPRRNPERLRKTPKYLQGFVQ